MLVRLSGRRGAVPAVAVPGPGGGSGRRRVAMLVLNTAESDARVLREAAALREAGHEVRVFAFSNRTHGPGKFTAMGVTVERLPVAVGYTAALRRLAALAGRRPVAEAGDRSGSGPGGDGGSGGGGAVAGGRVSTGDAEDSAMPAVPTPPAGGAAGTLLRPLLAAARGRALAVHRPVTVAAYWWAAARRVSAYDPDVVHAHDLNTLPAGAHVAARTGAALVYDAHELWRRRNRHGEYRPVARAVEAALERRYLRRADAVLTVSPGIADWLARVYGPAVPVRVLRNVPPARRPSSGTSLADRAGVGGDRRMLLYTGRAMRGRGLELAVDALPDLPDDVVLVLLGYGQRAYLDGLRARAAAAGVGERLRTVDAVPPDEVPALAAQAAAAVVAIEPVCESYRYALPNKLFEAVQAHLPVVASDLPDIAEVVRGHAVGELFPVGERAGFVRAARRVLASPEPYRRAAAAAAETLTWERERAVLLDLYADLPPRRR